MFAEVLENPKLTEEEQELENGPTKEELLQALKSFNPTKTVWEDRVIQNVLKSYRRLSPRLLSRSF